MIIFLSRKKRPVLRLSCHSGSRLIRLIFVWGIFIFTWGLIMLSLLLVKICDNYLFRFFSRRLLRLLINLLQLAWKHILGRHCELALRLFCFFLDKIKVCSLLVIRALWVPNCFVLFQLILRFLLIIYEYIWLSVSSKIIVLTFFIIKAVAAIARYPRILETSSIRLLIQLLKVFNHVLLSFHL